MFFCQISVKYKLYLLRFCNTGTGISRRFPDPRRIPDRTAGSPAWTTSFLSLHFRPLTRHLFLLVSTRTHFQHFDHWPNTGMLISFRLSRLLLRQLYVVRPLVFIKHALSMQLHVLGLKSNLVYFMIKSAKDCSLKVLHVLPNKASLVSENAVYVLRVSYFTRVKIQFTYHP